MTDLQRCDKAIERFDRGARIYLSKEDSQIISELAHLGRRVLAECREPDIEAAARELLYLADRGHAIRTLTLHEVRGVVAAALGGSDMLIVDRSDP